MTEADHNAIALARERQWRKFWRKQDPAVVATVLALQTSGEWGSPPSQRPPKGFLRTGRIFDGGPIQDPEIYILDETNPQIKDEP